MHKPIKYLEKAMSIAANGAWRIFCFGNDLVPENLAKNGGCLVNDRGKWDRVDDPIEIVPLARP